MALNMSAAQGLPFSLTLPDGSQETLSVFEVDQFYIYSVDVCINYATQLGASLMLLAAIALATKRERRRTPMFALNVLALLLNSVKLLLGCLYFTGPFNETYVYFSGDISLVPASAYGVSVAAVVLMFLLVVCLMVALTVQTHVVLVTLQPGLRRAILVISLLVALCEVGFRLAYAVINIRAIVNGIPDSTFDDIEKAKTAITALAVLWFSCVFTTRLGLTVWRRRSMGIKKLGPVEVLLTMGGQTLIIPAIFSIVQLCPTGIPVMDTNVLTCITIFLPLSSLWAASFVDGRHRPEAIEMTGLTLSGSGTRKLLLKNPFFSSKSASKNSGASGSDSFSPDSPAKARVEGVILDLERQGF